MVCSKCQQDIELGAAFCGNCGQPTGHVAYEGGYNHENAAKNTGEILGTLAILFGVIGAAANLILPFIAIGLAFLGLVTGTLALAKRKKLLGILGASFSVVAILIALGLIAYGVTHKDEIARKQNQASTVNTPIKTASTISTECYNLNLPFSMNTDSDQYDNCDVRLFEGTSIEVSNNVYKVYANNAPTVNEANFEIIARQAIEQDIKTTLPGFEISGQRMATFAGSPAYIVNAEHQASGVAVVEAAVLRKDADYNLFSIVHAEGGNTTDLKDLEAAWQWK